MGKQFEFKVVYESPKMREVSGMMHKADMWHENKNWSTTDIVKMTTDDKATPYKVKKHITGVYEGAGGIVHSVKGGEII